MKSVCIVLLLLWCSLLPAAAQTRPGANCRGTVLSALTHAPVAGAAVRSKVLHRNVVTGNDGGFGLYLPLRRDTLLVSCVGYHTALLPVDTLDVAATLLLEPATGELAEVVVNTGYQSLPKERATGSFASIDQQTLNQQVGPGILRRLDGVASGISFPGKSDGPAIMLRGLSTLQGPKLPLIVLDHFPYEGDINNINPNDVESVTLLKDAAAASIWGTRAGNGVIVIATKKGKLNQPVQVQWNASINIVQPPDLFALPRISSSDYIDVEHMLYKNGYYKSQVNSRLYPALTPVVELLVQRDKGLLSAAEAAAQIDALRGVDNRYQLRQYLYQPAVNQQYALNLSGGTATLGYHLFAGADRNLSEQAASYHRINLRMDNTYQPWQHLQLSVNIAYTQSRNGSGKPPYNFLTINSRQVPYLALADAQGNALPVARNLRTGYTDTAGGGKLLNWKYYPLTDYQHARTTGSQQDLIAAVGLQYKLTRLLGIDLKYQYEQQTGANTNLQDAVYYATRDLVNRFAQVNRTTGVVNYIVPPGGILGTSNTVLAAHYFRGQLNFNYTGFNSNLSALAGAEIRQVRTTGNSSLAYGYNPDILTSANVDFVNPYPSYLNGANQYIPNNQSFDDRLNRFVSYFANAAYTYGNRYTLSASARRDASNLFGVATNDRWTPLWSSGASWQLSREPFYRLHFLPELKLRATYGFSGNVDQSKSAVNTLAYLGTDSYTNFPVALVSQFANPQLRWEKVGMLNLGIDFSLVNQVLSGSVEYYHKKGTDLFGPALLDYTAGLGTDVVIRNVAAMKADGIDLTLQAQVLHRGLHWTTGLLFSYNNSVTTRFYRPSGMASQYLSSGTTYSAVPGRPIYSIASYRWAGLNPANGNPQGYLNGVVSSNYNAMATALTGPQGLVYGGPALPRYAGSFSNTFTWKNLSFSANIAYRLGYYFRRPVINYSNLYSFGNGYGDFARRWQQPGDELHTTVPSMVYPLPSGRDNFYGNSEVTVERADNIRLQYVNLAYLLDKTAWKKLPLRSIQAFVNASNLGILWRANKQGLDPDAPSSFSPARGIAFGLRGAF